jgi:hypothetical protein
MAAPNSQSPPSSRMKAPNQSTKPTAPLRNKFSVFATTPCREVSKLFGGPILSNAVGYAEHYSRSYCAVIRVYDDAGNVIETHEHNGDFKEW